MKHEVAPERMRRWAPSIIFLMGGSPCCGYFCISDVFYFSIFLINLIYLIYIHVFIFKSSVFIDVLM
ncbi:hypothetical protein CHELA41_23537 [Hyphomicrobiales bacterium]|nr:hypothetical protein CHELA41_23537 [Hyphomicrobiales bacterium]